MTALAEVWVAGFRTVDDGRTSVANYIWDTGSLAWVVQTGGGSGPTADVNVTNASLAVTQSGAWSVGITGSVAVTGPLTDAQLRASAVPVSLASTTITGSVAVTGPLTDTELRASAVPVSLASTTITGSVAVTGPLTDVQLRATPVPVSGTVAATQSGAWSTGRTWALAGGTDNVRSRIWNGTNDVAATALSAVPLSTDYGLTTQSVIYGKTTAGGGAFVEVKVNPSGALAVAFNTGSANARTSVAGAAADTLILAANASRLGATVYNDSAATLYLSLGTAAASLTDFTVKMVTDAYYEVPFGYTGQIRGIWASAVGSARVGEIT